MNENKKLLHNRGICVVIPTYNNSGTIVDVVQRTLCECDDVIVVCDGCTDDTLQLLEAVEGITLVAYEKNAGKGHALKVGFQKAIELGFSFAITLDGDGQHFPEDIPSFLRANRRHPDAIIVGERKFAEDCDRSFGSRFANGFSNFWFAVETGQYLRDTQTGYRLYPLKRLSGLWCLTSGYEAELELLVFASWAGVPLVSESIDVYYPPREERVSHFRGYRDFGRISLLNTVLCFLAVVYGYPRLVLRFGLRLLRTVYSLLFFLIMMIVVTPCVALYMSIGGKTDEKRFRVHQLLQSLSRVVLKIHGIPGVLYSEVNRGGESFDRPAVIICNHQSHLDVLALLIQSPKIVVLTKEWVWKNVFYGYLIRCAEFLPVYDGIDGVLPRLRELVERGYSIAVYPEGSRSEDCSISRFHQGAFHLAEQLGLDIVPMVLYGAGYVLPKRGWLLNPGVIRVEIDGRINPDALRALGSSTRAQASAMRKYYERRYEEVEESIIKS